MTHDELRDLASLYALDALTGSDRVEFEEHLGGCAGCTVEVHTDAGRAMKRVCVDGPVFAAEAVFS